MSYFKNKVVWLTGASSGIGEALAYELDRQGARIILSSRRADVLAGLKQKLTAPDRHRVVPLDLEKPFELASVVNDVLTDDTQVDVLINNGGVAQRSLAADTILEVDHRLMLINYLGTVAMTKALLPSMIQRGQGCVASVSSVAGRIGSQLRTGYSGSKFAVVGFMECLRAELWSKGIQVTVLCPGYVNTRVSINAFNGQGEPDGVMDKTNANGISAQSCAEQMLQAIAKGKPEVAIGKGVSRWGWPLFRVWPGLVRRVIRKDAYR